MLPSQAEVFLKCAAPCFISSMASSVSYTCIWIPTDGTVMMPIQPFPSRAAASGRVKLPIAHEVESFQAVSGVWVSGGISAVIVTAPSLAVITLGSGVSEGVGCSIKYPPIHTSTKITASIPTVIKSFLRMSIFILLVLLSCGNRDCLQMDFIAVLCCSSTVPWKA